MNQKTEEILAVLAIVLYFILLLLISGCSQPVKTITKYKYIQPSCPTLKTYKYDKKIVLTAYNKNDKVCIKEWDSCMPKTQFKKLVQLIKSLRVNLQKCNSEIELYNKTFASPNDILKNN
jgi:hypothetical protein